MGDSQIKKGILFLYFLSETTSKRETLFGGNVRKMSIFRHSCFKDIKE